MFRSDKIFVFTHKTGPASTADACTLLSDASIFGAKPDIQLSDFNFNFDGLVNPTFVIPGGAAISMNDVAQDRLIAIRARFANRFNFIGICAGAYVGAAQAKIFQKGYSVQLNDADQAGVARGVTAYGPVNPLPRTPSTKRHTPFKVTLGLPTSGPVLDPYSPTLTMSSLHIEGPGLVLRTPGCSIFKSRANYLDKDLYTFEGCKEIYTGSGASFRVDKVPEQYAFHSLPAVVSMPTRPSCGGIFLSGVHLESAVPDSKLLKMFGVFTPDKKHPVLPKEAHDQLRDDQPSNEAKVKNLLRETFSPRR